MTIKNTQVLLASRPRGWVEESNFSIVESDISPVGQNELLVKNLYLSLDPYMRGRMNDAKSYAAKVELGEVMVGATIGEVVESNNPKFAAGDKVLAGFGWQQYAVSDGSGLRKIEPGPVPLTAYLGAAGMPGVTAYLGLLDIGELKAGETVVVSAASGAVGSVVGQIAKIKGCRAVGIAGGKAKCDYVLQELGFDACIDYKAGNLYQDLKAAVPDGIDVYFDNVGGEVLDTVLLLLNAFARIPLCGVISEYNVAEPRGIRNLRSILTNRAKLQGFIVSEQPADRRAAALKDLGAWVASGQIKYRETITEGLENAPKALIGLLKGENFGKQLIKL
jgi:NADPH-dependent curcumin reductase CurA